MHTCFYTYIHVYMTAYTKRTPALCHTHYEHTSTFIHIHLQTQIFLCFRVCVPSEIEIFVKYPHRKMFKETQF